MILAAGVVTWMAFWMKKQARSIGSHLRSQVSDSLRSGGGLALAAVAFIAVAREGLETGLFLFASTENSGPVLAISAAIAGLAVAVVLGVAFYRGALRLDLRKFFLITGVLGHRLRRMAGLRRRARVRRAGRKRGARDRCPACGRRLRPRVWQLLPSWRRVRRSDTRSGARGRGPSRRVVLRGPDVCGAAVESADRRRVGLPAATTMLVLLTNDDGIGAEGLHALRRALAEIDGVDAAGDRAAHQPQRDARAASRRARRSGSRRSSSTTARAASRPRARRSTACALPTSGCSARGPT